MTTTTTTIKIIITDLVNGANNKEEIEGAVAEKIMRFYACIPNRVNEDLSEEWRG